MSKIAIAMNEVDKGGSVVGKAPNIDRDYEATHMYYMKKYFWPSHLRRPGIFSLGPEKPENSFKRNFIMPRVVLTRVISVCITHSDFIRQRTRP